MHCQSKPTPKPLVKDNPRENGANARNGRRETRTASTG